MYNVQRVKQLQLYKVKAERTYSSMYECIHAEFSVLYEDKNVQYTCTLCEYINAQHVLYEHINAHAESCRSPFSTYVEYMHWYELTVEPIHVHEARKKLRRTTSKLTV